MHNNHSHLQSINPPALPLPMAGVAERTAPTVLVMVPVPYNLLNCVSV